MITQLQQQLHYQFTDQDLLLQAMTHRSYLNEHPDYSLGHNERLEFLGDAVLQLIASDFLYDRFPAMPEGRMTRLRAWLVRTETLAAFGREMGLGEAIRMARGEEIEGGRDRDSILCDTFEAVVGAMYLDSDPGTVRRFVMPFFEPMLVDILTRQKDKDAKSLFQEWSQAIFRLTPTYNLIEELGAEHEKTFRVAVVLDTTIVGIGEGRNKQTAEQAAAGQAISQARVGALPYPPKTPHTAAQASA
jgi:ribonuclease III